MWKPNIFRFLLLSGVVLYLAVPAALRAQYSDQGPESGPNPGVDETVTRPAPRTPPPPPADTPKPVKELNPDQVPSFRANVDLVSVPVIVQDKEGNFVPGLKKENFQLLEDGVPQTIQKMTTGDAPMTVCMVVEYSSIYGAAFLRDTIEAAFGFAQSLRPVDWVAVIFYDMQVHVMQDFTHDKTKVENTLMELRVPMFSEANLFDAVHDSVQRMQKIDGNKAIVLISSGVDTFSATRYDQVLKEVQASDTPIYAIATGQAIELMADARGMSSQTELTFLQADNQLGSFAKLSGGRAYFPRFEGEFPSIYSDIAAHLRNAYMLSYVPTNTAHDGKFRKIKVDLLDAEGKPFKLINSKGKEIKYEVRTRDGYTAPLPVE